MIEKKYSKSKINRNTPSNNSQLRKIYEENKESFEKVKKLLNPIADKYNVDLKELITISEQETKIPVSIFNEELSSLESISRYLKDNLNLTYHDIGIMLNRDEKNIWHTYKNSLKKYPKSLKISKSKFLIPTKIFQDKKLSILESIVFYLKQEFDLRYSEIAVLIRRDIRTVWTVYKRAIKKNDE